MSRIRHQHLKTSEPGLLELPWDRRELSPEELRVKFLGDTYDPAQDEARLATALQRIRRALETGRAFTLKELAAIGQCSEAGASARVRDIRRPKEKGGCGLAVQSERVKGGLWRYSLVREEP